MNVAPWIQWLGGVLNLSDQRAVMYDSSRARGVSREHFLCIFSP